MPPATTRSLDTLAVRGGLGPDPSTGAVVEPICQSTTFAQEAVGEHLGYTYSRAANPTVAALEKALGQLEDAPDGVCFRTGLAAETALFLALLSSGDHVVCSQVVYGGTVRLLRDVLSRLGVAADFVDTGCARSVADAIRPETRLIFVETPGNPLLRLADIEAVAKIARHAGITLAVDNTFLTPVLQRPLELGADVCMYSTTKYIDGHNTTVGGAIISRDVKLLEQLRFVRKSVGSIQSPFDAWLTLRGLRTLPLRLRRHCANAAAVATWLERHPRVARVIYPGLDSFPQAALARRQHLTQNGGHGGLLAFEVEGSAESGRALLNNVRLCTLAENLGAAETLITHPATMTHGDVPRAQREAIGLSDGLIRLSVGLEDPADIIVDLSQAIDAATRVSAIAEKGSYCHV